VLTRVRRALRKGAGVVAGTPQLVEATAISRRFRNYTMIDRARYVDTLMLVQREAPPHGDVVECGVWRGGMIRGLAEVLGSDRTYHLFDSFEGLPPAMEIDGAAAMAWQQDTTSPSYWDNCTAEESCAKATFENSAFDAVFHRGWFEETIPQFKPQRPIGVLRLDGDWYDSTMTCLRGLVPHLAPNALVLVDDYYHWDGCSRAVHDFLSATKSTARIKMSAAGNCYWIHPPSQR
jgi:O-methyltransferase